MLSFESKPSAENYPKIVISLEEGDDISLTKVFELFETFVLAMSYTRESFLSICKEYAEEIND